MITQRGLWISVASTEDSAEKLRNVVERDGKFTAVVTASEIRPKVAELCLVSLSESTADYLGISRAGSQVVTNGKRLSISKLIDLKGLSLEEIKRVLPSRFRTRFAFPTGGAARITPKLWENILLALTVRPSVRESLPKLREHIQEIRSLQIRRSGGLEVFERDAVASAIQFWGGTPFRKRVLRSAAPVEGNEPATFLARLKGVSLREDAQVIHDAATFPGMDIARRYQVSAVELENESGERLTILHCNRQPLEQTLGVDLIYYNHIYDSFVLVQYKRMTGDGGRGPVYRPASDSNYKSEMTRMADVERLLDQIPVAEKGVPTDFRLSPRPFFLKFCETKAKAALDEGMVSGMYIPLGLWNQFIASADARGERGGLFVSWSRCPRNFNNSAFTTLLRSGWIGSATGQSKILSDIIGKVLEGQRTLIVAATSAADSNPDFRRDDLGRFASDDDPLASR
jgi:hypothetical protein